MLQSGCAMFDATRHDARKPIEEATLPPDQSAKACQAVGEKLARDGHIEMAIEQLLKARAYDKNADVSPVLARLYDKMSEDRLALDEYLRAVKDHPKDPDLWNDFGYYYYQHGNWDEAEQKWRKVIELDSKHVRGWTNLGLALGQKGQYPEALGAFEKAARPAEARCNLAFILRTQGKHDLARKLYEEALTLDPGLKLARVALNQMDRPAQPREPGRLPPLTGAGGSPYGRPAMNSGT
jgi:tetratricopeptide (TPR) repeat protein